MLGAGPRRSPARPRSAAAYSKPPPTHRQLRCAYPSRRGRRRGMWGGSRPQPPAVLEGVEGVVGAAPAHLEVWLPRILPNQGQSSASRIIARLVDRAQRALCRGRARFGKPPARARLAQVAREGRAAYANAARPACRSRRWMRVSAAPMSAVLRARRRVVYSMRARARDRQCRYRLHSSSARAPGRKPGRAAVAPTPRVSPRGDARVARRRACACRLRSAGKYSSMRVCRAPSTSFRTAAYARRRGARFDIQVTASLL